MTLARVRMKDRHWLLALLVGWLLLVGAPKWPNFFPASHWFEVRSISVSDSVVGVAPGMSVDRVIHRPFQADWIATVMRVEAGGGNSTLCTARGGNDYRPTASLPANLNLDWWTWPRKCDLPPGEYRLKTLWVLRLPEGATKEVRVMSDTFKIKAN